MQAAINEGSTLRVSGASAVARDAAVYRAYIALGNAETVLAEVPGDAEAPALQGVRLLASYVADEGSRTALLLQLQEFEGNSSFVADADFAVAGATIYSREGDWAAALKLLHQHRTLEAMAMQTQCLLRMDRVDLAEAQAVAMASIDDDHTLTKLALAWVFVAQGGDKTEKALEIYHELIDGNGSSLTLLNGVGVCNLHLRRFDAAEKNFIDAIGMGSNDPDTLINLITCARHTGKPPEFVERYVSQLKRAAPKHPYVEALDRVEASFDRVAATLDVA